MTPVQSQESLRQFKSDRKTDDDSENQRIFDTDEFKGLVREATSNEPLTDNDFIFGSHYGPHEPR